MIRKILAVLLVLSMVMTMVVGCGNKATSGEDAGEQVTADAKIITFNIQADPRSVDPALSSTTNENAVINQLFEGLTRQSSEGILPGVAKEWTIDEETNTYTFTLRDAKFSNGDEITAEDFVYSWKRALDPRTGAEYAYMLYYIKGASAVNQIDVTKADANEKIEEALNNLGVKAIDEKTLEVTLESLTPYFLGLVSFPTYHPVNKNVVEQDADWGVKDDLVSNGPYKMKEWKHGDRIVIVKNDQYWDKDAVKIDEIDFLMVEEGSTELTMWETGQLDITSENIPVTELERLESEGVLKKQAVIATRFISINTKNEPLDDVRVRNALSMALDRESITKNIIKASSTPSTAYVPTGMSDGDKDFRDVGGNLIEENIDKAKALLADAGYPDGKDFPGFEIMVSSNEKTKAIVDACVEMWNKNLNITNVDIRIVESKVASERRKSYDFDMTFSGWYGDYLDPMTFLELATSTSGQNSMQYSNPTYDQLIQDANNSIDDTLRMKKMHEAEAVLMEDMPLIPINIEGVSYLENERITGVYRNILNLIDFKLADIK